MIRCIAAIDEKRGLATNQGIPWKLPTDIRYFAEQTRGGTVLMGYRTYEEFQQPFQGRQNYVAVRGSTPPLRLGFTAVYDIPKFLAEYQNNVIWLIGGAGLFAQTLQLSDELYLTTIHGDFHCTKFFPDYQTDFILASRSQLLSENDITFCFEVWRRHHLTESIH